MMLTKPVRCFIGFDSWLSTERALEVLYGPLIRKSFIGFDSWLSTESFTQHGIDVLVVHRFIGFDSWLSTESAYPSSIFIFDSSVSSVSTRG